MDASNVRRSEWIAGISGVALFVILFFFDWYSVVGLNQLLDAAEQLGGPAGAGAGSGISGWDAFDFTNLFCLLALTFAVAYAGIGLSGSSPDLPVVMSAVTTLLGGLAFLFVLFRLVNPPGDGLERGIGVWLGLIATAGIALGGYMGMQEEGTSFAEQAD
ncbi:MAG: hypothetical protein EXQ70_00790 [Solirubrobacterales bacterium]|nr:hypothetical protein [Solirubrobacterales bacterium]